MPTICCKTHIDDCVGAYDECGVCNSSGITPGECDCDGNVLDARRSAVVTIRLAQDALMQVHAITGATIDDGSCLLWMNVVLWQHRNCRAHAIVLAVADACGNCGTSRIMRLCCPDSELVFINCRRRCDYTSIPKVDIGGDNESFERRINYSG